MTIPNTVGKNDFISDLMSPVDTDIRGTSVTYSHQLYSSYLDRIKIPLHAFSRWNFQRSDPVQVAMVLNAVVLNNGSVATYAWDRRKLKTFSFSYTKKETKAETIEQELFQHDRDKWISGPSQYIQTFLSKTGFRKSMKRIFDFSNLGKNWDSYGAKTIQSTTIARSLYLFSITVDGVERLGKSVPIPFIAPRPDGGIQFEWETCNKELTIFVPPNSSDPLEYLWVYSVNLDEEQEEEGILISDAQAINAVECLLSPNCKHLII